MAAPNSLAEILERLDLPADARVLDIGGPAYKGEESTTYLAERFSGRIDVIAARDDQRAGMVARFGKRIRLLADEGHAKPQGYDLVVISPVLGKLAETLLDMGWRASRLLRPGGVAITFGIDPAALGLADHKQPDPEVAEAFHTAFGGRDAQPMVLPDWLAQAWELLENTPRKPAFRSYLTWSVLRRRRSAGLGSLVEGMGADADQDAVRLLLLGQDFDTVMVFDPERREHLRTRRIAETLRMLGRRMLWVEAGAGALEIAEGPGGGTLLRFPDPTEELDRRLRTAGVTADDDARGALGAEAMGARIARLVTVMARPDVVVFSQGERARRAIQSGLPTQARWVHDQLDARLDRVGGPASGRSSARRPDVLTAVSATAASSAKATPLLDAQLLTDKFTYRGKSLRIRCGLKGIIIIYSGDGEGSDLARLGDVLGGDQPVQLAVLAGRASLQAKALRRRVRQLEADDRLCLLPTPPAQDIAGLIAEAELGVIGVDAAGRPEPNETARFSDYLLAGIPVVAPLGGEVAAILEDWPIGCTYDPTVEGSLAAAVAEALNRRAELASALSRRPDLLLRFSWESQAIKLGEIFAPAEAPVRRRRSGQA